ncbi:hypothetical protein DIENCEPHELON_52 [Klebsiella phage vB_KaeS_Diencephalon]|nr:hypothetical protein [Enterobacter phage ATCEA23]UGO51922.1 hypothetical protein DIENCEPHELON_52 [Klebsiella phage vB_KaeS_Diencephalon]
MGDCIAVVKAGEEVKYFPYHDSLTSERADELADVLMNQLHDDGHEAWKRVVYPIARVTTVMGHVFEFDLAQADIVPATLPGERDMINGFGYAPDLGYCTSFYAPVDTIEYIA